MSIIRTVLGDIEASDLGPTNYHEHLFQATPLLPGEELDDLAASTSEAVAMYAAGARAMVESTPIGLGRRVADIARIATSTGLSIVHVTGFHREAHYAADAPWLALEADLVGMLRGELLVGIDGTDHRAGVIKAGIGLWSITPFERRSLEAAGAVSAELGTPVMVHLEHGSATHEVLDLLAAVGCAAERVALAHLDRNPDPGLHAELAARGAYLGYDGSARSQYWPESTLIDCAARVAEAGYGDRLLFGGDVARASRFKAYGGMPGLSYLFDRYLPRVRAALGERGVDGALIHNPARWLGWYPPTAGG